MDEPTTGQDISHPLFVRLYRRGRVAAAGRGEVEHRRRLVAGLRGMVVEVGAGDGGNFPHYPPAVREVVAVEPELRFYEHVHADRQPLRAVLEVADRTRLWPLIAGGCHPNRRTVEAIEAAGFRVERVERFDFAPSPVLPAVPHVLGSARVTSSA